MIRYSVECRDRIFVTVHKIFVKVYLLLKKWVKKT